MVGIIDLFRSGVPSSKQLYSKYSSDGITYKKFKKQFCDIIEIKKYILSMNNEDYLEAAKAIYNYSKDNDFYKIKGGIIDGKVMTAEEIITLAKLPSRQELLAKLAGALLGNITKLAVALDQVKDQKANA